MAGHVLRPGMMRPLNTQVIYHGKHDDLTDARPLATITECPPKPARVVGCLALLINVLANLANRPAETLSASEADLQAFFDADTTDLLTIFDKAKEEMIAETADVTRAGVV